MVENNLGRILKIQSGRFLRSENGPRHQGPDAERVFHFSSKFGAKPAVVNGRSVILTGCGKILPHISVQNWDQEGSGWEEYLSKNRQPSIL